MIAAWPIWAPRLCKAAGLLAILGSLAGCTAPSRPAAPPRPASGSAATGQGDLPAGAVTAEDLPAGAIAVGPDLYQVPIGADAAGCLMYRLHSPTRMVTQAIAWRRPDGRFTLDRSEACGR